MRSITIYFEDKEFEALLKIKKKYTWHDFIMLLTKGTRKSTIEENMESEPELGEEPMDWNEVADIIREIEPEYVFEGKSGDEVREYAIKLKKNHL